MTTKKMRFPLTLGELAEFQAGLAGRSLSTGEIEVLSAWLPLFNQAYADGSRCIRGDLDDQLRIIDGLVADAETSEASRLFLEGARKLLRICYDAGTKAV